MLEVDRALSLEEVGSIYNLSRERVRQIETKALYKIVPKLRRYPDLSDMVFAFLLGRVNHRSLSPHQIKRRKEVVNDG